MSEIKPIAITMGEPAGIGAECTIKSWKKRERKSLHPFFLIDNFEHIRNLDSNIPLEKINSPSEALSIFQNSLPIYDIDLPSVPQKGLINKKNGKSVIKSIEIAVDMALKKNIQAVVTNPINKEALYDSGFKFPGHTEFLQYLCGGDSYSVMMIVADNLRVVPLTIHIPLKEVSQNINKIDFEKAIDVIHKSLIEKFSVEKPSIVVAGLNPHAGEGGTIGTEESKYINGWIKELSSRGINISGTYPADTLFHVEERQKYDAAVCFYHDQALIPAKTIDFYGGVNITLGLPIIRTSPDHGTALKIAGKGIAREDSTINAILMAGKMKSG